MITHKKVGREVMAKFVRTFHGQGVGKLPIVMLDGYDFASIVRRYEVAI